MPHAVVQPVVDYSVRGLCGRPYYGHPRGCPNVGRRDTCPPRAPRIERVLDLSEFVWAVWNVFDLGEHVALMRLRHPEWSDRQLRNCLYWQQGARRDLRVQIREFLRHYNALPMGRRGYVLGCPEASGVNVTATLASVGIVLEWPPRERACQVVLVGQPANPGSEEG